MMLGQLQQGYMVDAGSYNGRIAIPLAGKNNIELSEKVPIGVKRIFVFGNMMQEGGTARQWQIFVKNVRGMKYPISPLDNAIKGLEGNQVLNSEDILVVDIVAGADNTDLVWSLSYMDYVFPSGRRR